MTHGNLSVTEAEVIRFSQSLQDRGIPAWQRLQAVRAIEAYRDLVLNTQEPSLEKMRRVLPLGRSRKGVWRERIRPGIEGERRLIHFRKPPATLVRTNQAPPSPRERNGAYIFNTGG